MNQDKLTKSHVELWLSFINLSPPVLGASFLQGEKVILLFIFDLDLYLYVIMYVIISYKEQAY